jgi:hypothetical protein
VVCCKHEPSDSSSGPRRASSTSESPERRRPLETSAPKQTLNEPAIRAELFEGLKSLAESAPQMRVGQLVAAVGELCADLHGRGLWDAEDSELAEAIWRFRRGLQEAAVAANQEQT